MDASASSSTQQSLSSSNNSGGSYFWKNAQSSIYNYFFPSEKSDGSTFVSVNNSEIPPPPNVQPSDSPSDTPSALKHAAAAEVQPEAAESAQPASTATTNSPLTYDNFTREYRAITQQEPFEGLRVEVQLPFNKYLGVSHSLFVKNRAPNDMDRLTYQFGPTFTAENGSSTLMARIGNDGMVFATGQTKIGSLDLKLNSYSFFGNPQGNLSEVNIDKYGKNTVASLKLTWRGMFTMSGSLSYSLWQNLQLGGELNYALRALPGIYSVGARYMNGSHVFTGRVGTQSMPFRKDILSFGRLQYVRHISDRCSFGTEWEYFPKTMESGLRVGWMYFFRQAVVQGMVDSGGKICMFSQDMQTGSGVSAMLDYFNGEYAFGMLKTITPVSPQEQEAR